MKFIFAFFVGLVFLLSCNNVRPVRDGGSKSRERDKIEHNDVDVRVSVSKKPEPKGSVLKKVPRKRYLTNENF